MTDKRAIAEKLLQINAIKLSTSVPFTWASGWKSPIYCDNRKILSYPHVRDQVKSELCNLIFENFGDAELIAGVATAGIAWGALAADQLKLPFIYVRPKPKEHGLGKQIEGDFEAGKKVVVVEDLVSTAKSSLQVVDVLRKEGLVVVGMVSIFSYGFTQADESLAKAGVRLLPLTDYPELIKLSLENGLINETVKESLLNWRRDPENWDPKL